MLLPHLDPAKVGQESLSSLPARDAVFVKVPVSSFLEPSFLEAVLQNAEEDFHAMSCSTALESNQAVAFHQGNLYLRVHETAFARLGLPGKKCELQEGTSSFVHSLEHLQAT